MKNVLFLCLFLSFSLTQGIAQVSGTAVLVSEKNAISWDKTTVKLGEIPQGIPAEATFVLTNKGDKPLIIEKVKPTCGCTATGYSTEPVQPGQSTTITATYNAKKAGAFNKVVKVYTTQSSEPIPLILKGEVKE